MADSENVRPGTTPICRIGLVCGCTMSVIKIDLISENINCPRAGLVFGHKYHSSKCGVSESSCECGLYFCRQEMVLLTHSDHIIR